MRTLRKAAATTATAAIAFAGAMLINPGTANAHGATMFPGSRQYFCYIDGLEGGSGGDLAPTNPACQDAMAESGTTPLYNWFGNLHPSNDGGTVGSIPDGRICDGGDAGPYDFSPYNEMRDDWPRTHLTAGDTYTIQHNNWAHHPGDFNVYVTQQGWDPSSELSWSDLELIHTETNPPQNGGPGTDDGHYYWDVTFPSDRSGDHIVFIHWVRSDSPEDFFSCSDVAFDGGNGEVTGIGGDPGNGGDPPEVCPDEAPTTPGEPVVSDVTSESAHVMWSPSDGCVTAYQLVNTADGGEQVLAEVTGDPPGQMTDITGLEPNTSYEVAVRAVNDNTGDVSSLSASESFTTPEEGEGDPPEPGECVIGYEAEGWGDDPGFTASVTVTNTGGTDIDGWTLEWDYTAGQTVEEPGWSASVSQSGTTVTAENESWNGTISAGSSVTFGFNGTASSAGDNPAPEEFTLNGMDCSVE
ncbi:lytic polysaccharide monooxygenase [Phytoactinopolyspora halophila]|uniref:lytic polysaccharide monooxygenase n=1 Tax=Phytoactinopolyspora halophila TaxID=1981511 RepID=UPI000F5128D6|nr:lytic polysaccharide monooxygenase [Phytoactinopolyspora halophila]